MQPAVSHFMQDALAKVRLIRTTFSHSSVVGIKTCTKFQLEAKVIDFFVSQRFTATNAYVRCKSHRWNFVHVLMPTTLG